MKNLFLTGLVCALLWTLSVRASADDDGLQLQYVPQQRAGPQVSRDLDVAMAYYLLVQQRPDVKKWAMLSEEYQDANDFQKQGILENKVEEYKGLINMFTFSEPLGLKVPVKLSRYSAKNKGYIVLDIEDMNFLKYSFAGENFAVVPMNLIDHQFLPVPNPETVDKIEAAAGEGRAFTLVAYTKVNFADPPNKMTKLGEGEDYHLISGEVSYIALLDSGAKFLYDDQMKSTDTGQQDLLNLKQ